MTDQSQALEQRPAQTPVRAVPVPTALSELGIRIAVDEQTNNRLVLIPGGVRERVNVIDPVTSLVQADPNWTPRISIVELNPDADGGPHFYKQAGGKLAPTKQALEVLAKAAGILSTSTERIPPAELDAGEIGYRATVVIRRSDGTTESVQREKVWVREAERAEIEEAVKTARNKRWQHTDEAEVEKRWLKELRDRYAKTESKAVLRAIRAALQIPHTFTPADASKPFLVIGFNFTPDEETARLALPAAVAALYGAPPTPVERINLDTGEITTPAESADVAADPFPVSAADDQQAGEDGATPATAPGVASPVPGEPEPEPVAHVEPEPEADAQVDAAAQAKVPRGQHEGATLEAVAALAQGEDWLWWALRNPYSVEFGEQVQTFVRHRMPELWQRFTAWQDEQRNAA